MLTGRRNSILTAMRGLGIVCLIAGPTGACASTLATLERELRALVDSVTPSVVTIRSTCRSDRRTAAEPGVFSVGSGVVMDTLGHILTSARVVEDADDFWVQAMDGRNFQAQLVGTGGEVAVLQIVAGGLRPASFGEGSELDVGSFVAAVGNSYGFAGGLAWGEVNGFRPDGTIQLSLGVSAGSSGGALVNTAGEVIGLIKARISEPFYLDPLQLPASEGRTSVSIPGRRLELPTSSVSLATPIAAALRDAGRIMESGAQAPAYVGVYIEDLTGWYAAHFKTDNGVLVTGVVEHTPAYRYGLKPGDIITALDRESVPTVRRFRQIVAQKRPGERILLDLVRGGKPLKLSMEVGRADLSRPQETFVPPQRPVTSRGAFTTSETVNRPDGAAGSPPRRTTVPDRDAMSAETMMSDDSTRNRLLKLERLVDSLRRELDLVRRKTTP